MRGKTRRTDERKHDAFVRREHGCSHSDDLDVVYKDSESSVSITSEEPTQGSTKKRRLESSPKFGREERSRTHSERQDWIRVYKKRTTYTSSDPPLFLQLVPSRRLPPEIAFHLRKTGGV